jgi:hypothetical protein
MVPEDVFRNFFFLKVMKLLTVAVGFIFCSFLPFGLLAQDEFGEGARQQALAGASVAATDCWSVFGNQAGLAGINGIEVGGSFQNRFLVRELSTRSAFAIFPVQSSVFAVSFSQFGQIPFRREKVGIAYARQLTSRLSFGMQFNYYRLFLAEENRSSGSVGLELGCQFLSSEKLMLGLHIQNPYQTGVSLSAGNYYFPSRIRLGVWYDLSDDFSLTTELVNGFDRHLIAIAGAEYRILEKLHLRGGVSGKPYRLSGGMGFSLSNLIFDLAVSYDQYLGNSPSVSFQYLF